ncbi:hypothetical protein AVEN_274715-2-1, partial [Araneus ventricosus]
ISHLERRDRQQRPRDESQSHQRDRCGSESVLGCLGRRRGRRANQCTLLPNKTHTKR